MAAQKGEPGLARMIELLRGPIRRGVAVGALRPLAAFVHIVRQVAADALLRCAFVTLAGMTSRARHVAWLGGERKVRLVVVETGLLPRLRIMAGGAVSPERSVMNIILAMAVDAGRRGLAIGRPGAVAGVAGEGHVRVLQRKVRQIVCEAALAQLVDICVAAQVLRVAAPTLTR